MMMHDVLIGKYLQPKNIFRFVCTGLLFSLLILTFVPQGAASTLKVDDNSDALVMNVFMAASEKGAECSMAPVNPKFVEYQTQMNTHEMSSSVHGMGYAPSPVDLSHIKEGSMTSAEASFDYDSYFSVSDSSYDLRNYEKVTSIKNQGSAGTCWAFATYASLESYLLPGTDTPIDTPEVPDTPDFSENNMKNLLNKWPRSPYEERFDFREGGNSLMSAAYLTRWSGPIDEDDDPYTTIYGISPEGLSEQKHVQEVLWIDSDIDTIKDAVMTYGAVQMSFYYNDAYYNKDFFSYYYSGSSYANHAVAIVGWDDEFTAPGFPEEQPGAYIIKNSWGPLWGDDGFFYMSYYDSHAGDFATVFTAEESDNYDNIYQYDPLGWVNDLGYASSTAWAANVFTAEADETLEAVSFYTTDAGTYYEIYVYLDPTSAPIGSSDSPILVMSDTCDEVGYHTIPLDPGITISSGQEFSVVIKFTTSGYGYPIAAEYPINGYSSKATANDGESYVRSDDGSAWEDISNSWEANACIKAFTSDATSSGNRAPVLNPIGDRTVAVDETLVIELSAIDPDDDELSFDTNATFGTFDGQNLTWTPDDGDAGKYSVEFNVTDGLEVDSEVITITVTVNEVNLLIADFTSDTTKGKAPLTVNFKDESLSGSDITSWKWDFGDGGHYVESPDEYTGYVEHRYELPGTYDVSLTVTNSDGGTTTETKYDYIRVLGNPNK